ncbi:MAG: tetratricopeptide repeat protein [Polyangiaceae bacterium]|nr:tetratricopeptide repeat protein [Polyangiaceae bacterium]
MSSPVGANRPWLFGPAVDLLFGCGIGYALLVVVLAALGLGMDRIHGWLPFVILVTGLPHYGATLERVYSTPAARKRYGRYSLLFGLLVWGAFVGTLVSGKGATALVTLYLTWSPWHYAAQNFGLVMMFLRRARAEVSPTFRLLVKSSFVLSFLLVFVNIHRGSSASVNDPLYAAPSARDAVRFAPLGIPDALSNVLVVAFGAAYLVVTIACLVLVFKRTPSGARAPILALLASQSVWFVLPVALGQFVPEWVGPMGPVALAFIWVAIAHSVQYLWISLHFARASGRTDTTYRSIARYFSFAVFAGAALWVFPVLASVKGGLTRMPHESGLDMVVAAAVNLHHFLLDGVIWKLRDAPVREALVDEQTPPANEKSSRVGLSFGRVLLASVGTIAVASWIIAAWEQEVGRRHSVAKGDLARLEMAARRLTMIGRDGPRIHQAIAKIHKNRGEYDAALVRYRRSIELWPTASAWVGIGKIHEVRGQFAEARNAYEAALSVEPNHASALDDLAHVIAAQGDLEGAVRMQRRAIIAAPDRMDLRRRYDALLVKLPIAADDATEEIIVDVYDAGVVDSER